MTHKKDSAHKTAGSFAIRKVITMHNINIRKADSGQAGIFAEILCKSWQSAYSGIIPKDILAKFTNVESRRKSLEKWMSGGEAVYLLAYCDDIPCGACCVGTSRDSDCQGSGEIVAIYLLEEYWGCGIGRALMREALKVIKAMGLERAILWVLERNARARRFYEKCGFLPDGVSKSSGLGEEAEIRYSAEISSVLAKI